MQIYVRLCRFAIASALLLLSGSTMNMAVADTMTIASYNFFSGSSSSAPGTWGSPITFGAGISGQAFTGGLLEVGGDDTLATTGSVAYSNFNAVMGPSITGNQYASFLVTIPNNVVVDLTELSYDYVMFNVFDFGMGAFSSSTGFALGDELSQHFDGGSGGNPSFSPNIDLSSNPAFQNLTNTVLEFRLYMGDSSSSSARAHQFDNIELIGDVTLLATPSVVPEPGSIAIWTLAGAAMAGFGVWRRRLGSR